MNEKYVFYIHYCTGNKKVVPGLTRQEAKQLYEQFRLTPHSGQGISGFGTMEEKYYPMNNLTKV